MHFRLDGLVDLVDQGVGLVLDGGMRLIGVKIEGAMLLGGCGLRRKGSLRRAGELVYALRRIGGRRRLRAQLLQKGELLFQACLRRVALH